MVTKMLIITKSIFCDENENVVKAKDTFSDA